MTTMPGASAPRRRPTPVSRTTRRQQACLAGLLHGLTDVPARDVWAALDRLPPAERERLCGLAAELADDLRRTAAQERRRQIAADAYEPAQPILW